MPTFSITYSVPKAIPIQNVSAVFVLAFQGDKLAVTKHNEGVRVWDIPGGHVEPGETLLQAVRREGLEEAGIRFRTAKPFAIISADKPEPKYAGKFMLNYWTNQFTLTKRFETTHDIVGRELMHYKKFLEVYYGTNIVGNQMKELILTARKLSKK